MTSTAAKLAELKTLRNKAGILAYQRVKLAAEIWADKAWIAEVAGENDSKAAKILEDEYFSDLCGSINFFRLLKIYREFPKLEEWEENKFNLMAMSAIIAVRERTNRPKRERASATIRQVEDLEEKLHMTESRYKRLEEKYTEVKGQLEAAVREKNKALQQLAEANALIEKLTQKKAS